MLLSKSGGIARNRRNTPQRSSQGTQTATAASANGAQPLTARTVWYVEGNSKAASPTLHCLLGKRSAQAWSEEKAGGVRDQSRLVATRHEARGNAREPDGGTPERIEAESTRSAPTLTAFNQVPLSAASPMADDALSL